MTIRIRGREISAIISDVDGTFYDQGAIKKIFNGVRTQLSKELLRVKGAKDPSRETIDTIRDEYVRRSELVGSFPQAFIDMGGSEDFYHQVVDQLDRSQFLEPDPQLFSLLQRLKGKSKLGILTSAETQVTQKTCRKLLGDEWRGLFAAVVCCDTPGLPADKPDIRAFQFILEKLGATPEKTAMIGDVPTADILPAKSLGIFTIQVGMMEGAGDIHIPTVLDFEKHLEIE